MNAMQRKAEQHHREQFGNVTVQTLVVKLMEEVGELSGAIIRDLEMRNGKEWTQEINSEMKDVMVVLNVLAARCGIDLPTANNEGVARFLKRSWDVEKQ